MSALLNSILSLQRSKHGLYGKLVLNKVLVYCGF